MSVIHIDRAIPSDAMAALDAALKAEYPMVSGMSARTNDDGTGYVDVIIDGYANPAQENGIRQMVLTWDTDQRTPEQEAAAALAAALVAFENDLATLRAGLSEVYAVHDCAALVQSLCDMVGTLYKALPK